jgi:two-component system catabolic regulation response regulator CreB
VPSKPTILVVEDEPSVAEAIVYALRTDGCVPIHVTTGTAALAAIQSATPDLIVLDVGLPDANGFDLCRQIRRSRELSVIFLTARAEETDRVVGLELGARTSASTSAARACSGMPPTASTSAASIASETRAPSSARPWCVFSSQPARRSTTGSSYASTASTHPA